MLLRITARFALIAAFGCVVLGSHICVAAAATMAPMPGPAASGMAKPAGSPTPVPTPTPTANPQEAAFIADVTEALQAKYPTAAAAAAAGYFQMTRMEDDGTVIWFNDKWNDDVSEYAPNFLWYDKAGKLVGLDYQYAASAYPSPQGTAVYPVMTGRWTTIDAHIHFAYKLPDGTIKRRGAEMLPKETGDPTAAQLKAAKLLPANATLLWAHYHPKTWDLGFWLVPNVNGAFADENPAVKP
jgi:hypothetical protein